MYACLDRDGAQVEYNCGIPFSVVRESSGLIPFNAMSDIQVGQKAKVLHFLGMVTKAATGECGWVGERQYHTANKLFIGDHLGSLEIRYEGNIMDAVPLIFGVNVWNYEMFYKPKDFEYEFDCLIHYYPEPFASDEAMAELLRNSLMLTETDGDKYSKFIFTYLPRERMIEQVVIKDAAQKSVGVGISAVTYSDFLSVGDAERFRAVDSSFFVKREYFEDMDRLARKLYQFADELPEDAPRETPEDYSGPSVAFYGTPEAEILTNVYSRGICDMNAKLGQDGITNGSTKGAPLYGFYAGLGTFKKNGQCHYYGQCWSRDSGRLLGELAEQDGREIYRAAADYFIKYLYDPGIKHEQPNWRRIMNSSEFEYPFPERHDAITGREIPARSFAWFARGKENDGHASIMLAIYKLYRRGIVDKDWLIKNMTALMDAARWFIWQMDNPEESGFDKVLCSESETSYGDTGGYVLYANHFALHALRAFAVLMGEISMGDKQRLFEQYADILEKGIDEVFFADSNRFGKVYCEPESENWPSNLKRCAELMLYPDLYAYDICSVSEERYQVWQNTYDLEKQFFYNPRMGGSMGYGQAYTTQCALLLDRFDDLTECLRWVARFSYFHSGDKYLVPEGVTCHPSGMYWFRHTDLGNIIQEAEIIKCLRLTLGLDDLSPETGLRLVPRLSNDWTRLEALRYPVVVLDSVSGSFVRIKTDWIYERVDCGYRLELRSEFPLLLDYIRVGPFPNDIRTVHVKQGDEPAKEYQTVKRGESLFVIIEIKKELCKMSLSISVKE